MAVDTNKEPYFDDYDETKNFHRILYKPTFPVQARELTQQQTILQQQIKRMGTHLFNEGAMIIPGDIIYDSDVHFVTMDSTVAANAATEEDLETFWLNKTVFSQGGTPDKNVQAQVVAISPPDELNQVVLYIKYVKGSDDGTVTLFTTADTLEVVDDATTSSGALSSVGKGTSATIRPGVYFIRGFFVNVYEQRVIIDKDDDTPTKSVGLQIVESIVTFEEDESILDNATGIPNESAPGADRLKIELVLTVKEISDVTDENFIELLRVIDGEVVKIVDRTSFNIIGDELASRTFDESGHYTVDPFIASVEEDSGQLQLILDSGKAFVNGYEVRTLAKTKIDLDKATDTATKNSVILNTEVGNSVRSSNFNGTPFIGEYVEAELYDELTDPLAPYDGAGTQIGTARIRSVSFVGGSPGTFDAIYDLKLFDIQLDSGKSFRDVKQIRQISTVGGVNNFTANIGVNEFILDGSIVSSSGSLTQLSGTSTRWLSVDGQRLKEGDIIAISGITDLSSSGPDPDSGYFVVDVINSDNDLDVTPILSTVATPGPDFSGQSGLITLLFGELQDTQENLLLFPLPNNRIEAIVPGESVYDVAREFEQTATVAGNVTFSGLGAGEVFGSTNPADFIVYDHTNNTPVDLSTVAVFNPTTTQIEIEDPSLASAKVTMICPVTRTNAAANPKTKTLKSTLSFPSEKVNVAANGNKKLISLGKADVVNIISIIENGVNDVTSLYSLDNGQRDNFYAVGNVALASGNTEPSGSLEIEFEWFDHGSSGSYFSVDSYINAGIAYEDIPNYVSTNSGDTFSLTDVLDFRPRLNDAGTDFTGATASTTEIPLSRVQCDYSFFLPRIDKLYISPQGDFNIIKGSPSISPKAPDDPKLGMVLYNIGLKANTLNTGDVYLEYVENKRYTMRDIGKLENRIETLEYYTELTLLEKETADFAILDSEGLDRFKNGFMVDPFSGHGVGDVLDDDYKCSIDMQRGEMRPRFQQDNVPFVYNSTLSGTEVTNVNDLVLLDYTDTLFVSQPVATSAINVNPYNVFSFLGSVDLDPKSDQWKDVKRLPDLNTSLGGDFDAIAAVAESQGTVWGEWEEHWNGKPTSKDRELLSREVLGFRTDEERRKQIKRRKRRKEKGLPTRIAPGRGFRLEESVFRVTKTFDGTATRQGTKLKVTPKIVTRDLGDKVVNVSYIAKMRSIDIKLVGKAFKPTTKLYPFFDDVDVSQYVAFSGEFDGFVFPDFFVDQFAITNAGSTEDIVTLELTQISSSFNVDSSEENKSVLLSGSNRSRLRVISVDVTGTNPTISCVYDNLDGAGAAIGDEASMVMDGDILVRFSVDSVATNAVTIPDLLTSAEGKINGVYNVPAGVFNTGERVMKLTDDVNGTNVSQDATTSAESKFFAQGLLEEKQRNVVSITTAQVSREVVQEEKDISKTVTSIKTKTKWVDPIAQSFLVTEEGGMYVTKINVYFRTKDNNIPVQLEIREMQTGLPSSLVVPFSQVTKDAADVHTNRVDNNDTLFVDDVEVTGITPNQINENFVATEFVFDTPVYLQEGSEYAFVVLANSDKYELWRAKAALIDPEPKIGTDTPISENPYAGSMFKSQNSSTWTPEQESDVMFDIFRASFTATSGTAVFDNAAIPVEALTLNPLETADSSTLVRVTQRHHGMPNGSKVVLFGIDEDVNGIVAEDLNGLFTISNVREHSYVIDVTENNAGFTGAGVTDGFGGGENIVASRNISYETLRLIANTIVLPGTDIVWSLQTTSTQHPYGNQQAYIKDSTPFNIVANDDVRFDSPRMVASSINQQFIGASTDKSLVLQATLFTTRENISPSIGTERLSATLIHSELDNKQFDVTYDKSSDNYTIGSNSTIVEEFDVRTRLTAKDIDITQDSSVTNEGILTTTDATDGASLNIVELGNHILIENTNGEDNDGLYLVTGKSFTPGGTVEITLSITKLDGDITTFSEVGVDVKHFKNYVDEKTFSGTSGECKYITKRMVLAQPATALRISHASSVQDTSDIEVYYKIQTTENENIPFELLPYRRASFDDAIPVSVNEEDFLEYVSTENDLPEFTAAAVKLVKKGTDPTKPPLTTDLRIIALGT